MHTVYDDQIFRETHALLCEQHIEAVRLSQENVDLRHDLDALMAEMQYYRMVIGRLSGMGHQYPERYDENGNLTINPHVGRWATPDEWLPDPDAPEEEWLEFSRRYTEKVVNYTEGGGQDG